MTIRAVAMLSLLSCSIGGTGCSSADTPASHAAAGPPGGAVSGREDDHCIGRELGISRPAVCTVPVNSAAGGASDDDDQSRDDGGAADCSQTHDADFGATLHDTEGDDDDCKYHASWTSTPIRSNEDVTFTLTASAKADHSALEGLEAGENALSRVEVYEPCAPTHLPPAQDFRTAITETSPGVYSAGPLRFDQSGRWVIRFHFYEQCFDQEDSPHGHIAFFIDVP